MGRAANKQKRGRIAGTAGAGAWRIDSFGQPAYL
jgi:hypothetical protein